MEGFNDVDGVIMKAKKRKNFLWSIKPEWITALLQIMCEFVDANLKSAQGFKDAVYQGAAHKMKEKFGIDVTGEQYKNQVRHQRSVWNHVQELKKKSGVSWDEQKKVIVMGHEEYTSHIQFFPKDAAYLNIPIANYVELEKVCGEGHATGDWAKSSASSASLGVQQLNLSNDDILSFMSTELDLNQQVNEFSNVEVFENVNQCSQSNEVRPTTKEISCASKATTSRKRSRVEDRTLHEYASIVADSVVQVAHAIENQVFAKAAQEREVFKVLMLELEKVVGFTEDEVDVIYDYLSAHPSMIQPFLSRPEESKARWMRKNLSK